MVVLRQRSTNYWFFFINEYVDRTPLAEFFLLLYLLCRSWVATRAMDDDALSFPFFDNSRMALACGGPGVVQIILSYCEATVAAFLRLHHFEIQERKGPSASFELLYPKKQESGQDQDPEAWRTNFENRIYRQLSAYLDFMFAFEQETIKKATEQPPPHCYLEMYNLQQNVDSLFMKRIVELRNLQQQRISEIYTERLRSNLSRWVAGENVYHLPKNSNATKFHPVNNAMSLWGPTAGTAVNMVAPCGPQGLGLVTKDQIDKLIKATTIRYSRSSSGLGISLLYYETIAEIVISNPDVTSQIKELKYKFTTVYSSHNANDFQCYFTSPTSSKFQPTTSGLRIAEWLIWANKNYNQMYEQTNELQPLWETFNISQKVARTSIIALILCSLAPQCFIEANLARPSSVSHTLLKNINEIFF